MDDLAKYLERLSSVHKSTMRKFAQKNELQMVHVEIVQYLSNCNRYSNTAQALSEYFGQTKGSISQTISNLEENGLLKKSQDRNDKRVYHLELTAKGKQLSERIHKYLNFNDLGTEETLQAFKKMLSNFQKKNDFKSFGVCSTCKYNQPTDGNKFRCGLTEELLSKSEASQICREHEASRAD